jgi:hypothetical protein
MFILVDKNNTIVGSATNPIDEADCSKNNLRVFKIPKEEFSYDLIGQKLEDFEESGDDGI